MGQSGFFIFALGVLAVDSSDWYFSPASSKSWDYFRPLFYYEQPQPTPLELMVDITNALGVAILQDQSYSKANFAFSPYGVASVLVVLYEGSQGESARQIQRAVKFPLDKNLIRLGFRDIHRYLRSYFSHEGYLSGIALNKDNLALKPDYKKILNFYGYDVSFSEKGNHGFQEENNGTSTTKIPTSSTTFIPLPTATTLVSTTSSSFIEDDKTESKFGNVPETSTYMEKFTSRFPDTTIFREIEKNETDLTQTITESSTIKQSGTEKEENHESNQEEIVNSVKDKETIENTNNSPEITTEKKVTTSEIKTEITTEGIGAALDNGMLIPQLGDLETTNKLIEKNMEHITEKELSNTSSGITEVQTLTTINKETKESTYSTEATTEVVEETENNSFLLNIETTEEILKLSTLNEIKEDEISSNFTASTPVVANEITTNIEEITETVTPELLEETTEAVTSELPKETIVPLISTSIEIPTTTELSQSSLDRSNKVENHKKNLKKKRSISLNSVRMWSQISVVTASNATKSNLNLQLLSTNKSSRIKRSVADYLRLPVDSDFTIQLQNGVYDTYNLRNLNFYKNLPRQLFLVNYDVKIPVPMITHFNIFPYGYIPKLYSKALEFPLDDIRYKLLILLPVEKRGLKQLVFDLGSCSLREIIKSLRPSNVRVSIPMFMAEGFVVLTSSLRKLGIKDVFESDKANLSGMSTDSELYVRNIEQSIGVVIRNYVEMLDIETRTMAARHVVQEFEATHPFVYFVLDTATNVALMAGQILDPLNTRIY